MTDPERLLRNPPSPLALLLLRACAEEKPSAAALRRTAKAAVVAATLGAATKSASAAGTAAGTKLAATGLAPGLAGASALSGGAYVAPGTAIAIGTLAKWFGIGAVGGVLALPLAEVVIPKQTASPAEPLSTLAAQPSERTTRATREARKPREVVLPSDPHVSDPPEAVAPRKIRGPGPEPSDPGTLDSPARTNDSLLAAEVAFVDRGRAALQRGALDEALELLAPYERRFARQQLLTEVLFLRMEAFSRAGDAEQARRLAERVITRGIAGPQALRAREVLGR